MTESAGTGLRERRMAETRASLTRAARRLTAERGLSGFTVEELCETVGVSRRTFFNYFPSKDAALVGYAADQFDDAAIDAFLTGGSPRAGALSDGLLDDLADLVISQVQRIGISPAEAAGFIAAVEREPQLLKSLVQSGTAVDAYLIELVQERDGLRPGDARARAAVLVLGALTRSSFERFFRPDNTEPFDRILRDALAAATDVFTSRRLDPEPHTKEQS
jgi:AcrR family transcriptional regulator